MRIDEGWLRRMRADNDSGVNGRCAFIHRSSIVYRLIALSSSVLALSILNAAAPTGAPCSNSNINVHETVRGEKARRGAKA